MILNELKIDITNKIDVYRLTRTGDDEEYGGSPVITGLDAQIIPASNDIAIFYPDIPTHQLFDMFIFTTDDIKNGDKFTDGSSEWIIRGVSFKISNLMTYQRLVGQQIV